MDNTMQWQYKKIFANFVDGLFLALQSSESHVYCVLRISFNAIGNGNGVNRRSFYGRTRFTQEKQKKKKTHALPHPHYATTVDSRKGFRLSRNNGKSISLCFGSSEKKNYCLSHHLSKRRVSVRVCVSFYTSHDWHARGHVCVCACVFGVNKNNPWRWHSGHDFVVSITAAFFYFDRNDRNETWDDIFG